LERIPSKLSRNNDEQIKTQPSNKSVKSQLIPDKGGNLSITVLQGKLIRNTESIGKMDPYVLVEFRGKLFKTNVCQEGGTIPIWNFKLPEDLHLLPPINVDEEINLRCME
jgi:Ca2+-dependent lipid-binding protein